ncbi:uncharacterized protein LOC124446514 isoform X2 [Xenia sp. Carnegie-2017]|uniref:uncharacterized protein LOC124446514 isoform X2 n=1 Tax=Xenia sp. Carnegie-2017 TaxID=2897299 RepID=UPI001F03B091|nr:uncharacterized protein LOC124446514 isoform X2 [Xenia sp. Carnegie-2017]
MERVKFIVLLLPVCLTIIAGKLCKFEYEYVCGNEDCKCRFIHQNGLKVSRIFKRIIARLPGVSQLCDTCPTFCSKEKRIICQYGSCDKNKGCICQDCWSGETCSKYRNKQPMIEQTLYFGHVKKDVDIGHEIVTVSAVDDDLETCVDKSNCPCGRIKYAIIKGNDLGLFHIHPDSGVVSLVKKPYDHHELISITILAKNDEYSLNKEEETDKNKATVFITFQSDELRTNVSRERRSLHHRTRRSVTSYSALEINFEATTNQTFFPSDSSIDYRLYVKQNSSASPEQLNNVSILLKSDNLKLPSDKSGYSVNISNSIQTIGSFEHSESNNIKFTVPNTIPASGSQAYMEIHFNTTVPTTLSPLALLQVTFIMNATTSSNVPVTFGPKYSNEIFTTYPEITLRRTTSGVVKIGDILSFDINITFPNFNFHFILSLTTMINQLQVLSIENWQIINKSDSVRAQSLTQQIYTGKDDNTTRRVILDFGRVEISKNDSEINTMRVSFSVKVNDHYNLKNETILYVGVGAFAGSTMVGVTQNDFMLFKNEPYLFAKIDALNSTTRRYFFNDIIHYSWTVEHANGSYENAENVTVTFLIPKWLNLSKNEFLTPSNYNQTSKSLMSVHMTTLPMNETLSGILTLTVNEFVMSLDDLNIKIQLAYQTSKGVKRPVETYKASTSYIAGLPLFKFATDCAQNTTIDIGQVIDITLDITVNIQFCGHLSIFTRGQNSSVILKLILAEQPVDVSKAENILIQNKNAMFYRNHQLDLGCIRKKDISSTADESNTVKVHAKVILEDTEFVKNLTTYFVGFSFVSNGKFIWVSELSFFTNISPERRPRIEVTPSSNGSGSLFQGSVVEYNFTISHKNNSRAQAFDIEVLWMLPSYTKFLQVNRKHFNFSRKEDNVMFKLDKLAFGETVYESFSVAIDPNKIRKKPGKNYVVTPLAVTYKNSSINVQKYFEPLLAISVAFEIPDLQTSNESSLKEFYSRGYLVDRRKSIVYICSVSSSRDKPSCFWSNSNGATWQALHVSVINIIKVDSDNQLVYGIGSNKNAYMKYSLDKDRWYIITNNVWASVASSLSSPDPVHIDTNYNHNADPEPEKQTNMTSGDSWGANKLGIFYRAAGSNQWSQKACWDCFP